jgi:serine/alanine adding enzyme
VGNTDIYFDDNYGKLYEDIEHGKAVVYNYTCELGSIKYQFIKREISIQVDSKTYFDIVTPYGYGGPLITEYKTEHTAELVNQFEIEFKKYCGDNDIVSEFVRFHPIINNVKDFKELYSAQYMRHTLGADLANYEDPVNEEFSKECRKKIKRLIRVGVTYKITSHPASIRGFKQIYYSTMDRNTADAYYYFGEDYFDKILKYFKDNVIVVEAIYEDKTIAEMLCFTYNDMIHVHLSGTLSEYINMSPAYILRYGLTIWGKEHGYKLIHFGGGKTNEADDSLFKFKKKFAQNTEFDFYIGKKIRDYTIYNKLCDMKQVSRDIDYFPAYRVQNNKSA